MVHHEDLFQRILAKDSKLMENMDNEKIGPSNLPYYFRYSDLIFRLSFHLRDNTAALVVAETETASYRASPIFGFQKLTKTFTVDVHRAFGGGEVYRMAPVTLTEEQRSTH
ncbi:hypothetical protein V2J09_018129 [Rumex salicifolius]